MLEHLKRSIIAVDGGRGFVVEADRGRFVITAAHNLPFLPPPMIFSYLHERTYRSLLGTLGGGRDIAAECVFVDPVSDVAVLGGPSHDDLYDELERFEELVNNVPALAVGSVPATPRQDDPKTSALMLSLGGAWFGCTVRRRGHFLWWDDVAQGIESGMSGSPIISETGEAVGVVTCGHGKEYDPPQPAIAQTLPHWLAAQLLPGGSG